MKNSKLMIAVAFSLFVLVVPVLAQTGSTQATIPFAFTVGKQTLAAGDYRVSIDGSMLLVAHIGGKGAATAMTNLTGGGPGQDSTPRLIFHRYGDRHFLAEAWIGEVEKGHVLFASSAELEYARTTKQDQTTVLASRLPNK